EQRGASRVVATTRRERTLANHTLPQHVPYIDDWSALTFHGRGQMAEWQRTHLCHEIREGHVGQTVTLNGWVLTVRKDNFQFFIDLRDRYGLTQVVFHKAEDADLYAQATELKSEWVLSITGAVRKRLPGAERTDIPTGAVEVEAKCLRVLN